MESMKLIIGSYAAVDEESMHICNVLPGGKMEIQKTFKAGENISYIAKKPNSNQFFAIHETEDYEGKNGAVSSFRLKNGEFSFCNRKASGGQLPVYILYHEEENSVLVANYNSGTIAVFPIQENGKLAEASDILQHKGSGPNKERQESAHVHQIIQSPDHQFVFAIDLGMDQIRKYTLNNEKLISPQNPIAFIAHPGSGPRQLIFHPDGKHSFLVHELKSIISFLRYNSDQRTFQEISTHSCIPSDFKEQNKCGGVKVSPDGKTVYVTNRGHNSISSFSVDIKKELIAPLQNISCQGDWPREFCMDNQGQIIVVANQKSNSLSSFKIDQETGFLHFTGYQIEIQNPAFCLFYF